MYRLYHLLFPQARYITMSHHRRNFDLREGDLTDVKTIPAEWKQKFDLVNMRLVLMWIPRDRWSGLAQVLRFVTKPGGWFQSIDFAATEDRTSSPDRWGVRLLNHTFRQWLRLKSDVHHHPEEIMDMVRGHLTLSTGNWMTCKFEERWACSSNDTCIM